MEDELESVVSSQSSYDPLSDGLAVVNQSVQIGEPSEEEPEAASNGSAVVASQEAFSPIVSSRPSSTNSTSSPSGPSSGITIPTTGLG